MVALVAAIGAGLAAGLWRWTAARTPGVRWSTRALAVVLVVAAVYAAFVVVCNLSWNGAFHGSNPRR